VYQSLAQTNDSADMSIATGFLQSAEFQAKYGNLSDAVFITEQYANVLGRAPEAGADKIGSMLCSTKVTPARWSSLVSPKPLRTSRILRTPAG
jgi:hypothetical protein